MQGLQPISGTSVRRYVLNKTNSQMTSMPNTTAEKHLKPLIIPQETPEQVLTGIFKSPNYKELSDYQAIINHLVAFGKAGELKKWDDYAPKIPDAIREIWKRILFECRRNGFIAPYVYNNELIWRRIMTHSNHADLCTLCERSCHVREGIDTGEFKWRKQNMKSFHEPNKCWKESEG
jgi:hypothetical protein